MYMPWSKHGVYVQSHLLIMGHENPPRESMGTIATDSLASNRFDALSAIRAS